MKKKCRTVSYLLSNLLCKYLYISFELNERKTLEPLTPKMERKGKERQQQIAHITFNVFILIKIWN